MQLHLSKLQNQTLRKLVLLSLVSLLTYILFVWNRRVNMNNLQDDKTKLDLLKFFYTQSKEEIKVLRGRQDKIFTWVSSILVLFIGALLVIDPSKEIVLLSLGLWGKIIFSFAIFLTVIFSIRWQQRNRIWQEENKKVINRIAILLHCFEENYYGIEENVYGSLFPKRWNKNDPEFRKRQKGFWERLLPINFASITCLLGILAIVLIWLPR